MAFALHLHREEEIQAGANDGNRAQLADLFPTRRNCSREDVGAELKFLSEGEVTREGEANRGELRQVVSHELPQKLNDRDHNTNRDLQRPGGLDSKLQPLDQADDGRLDRGSACFGHAGTTFSSTLRQGVTRSALSAGQHPKRTSIEQHQHRDQPDGEGKEEDIALRAGAKRE